MSTYDLVKHIHENDAPAVLATLIRVEGHSYRKPGAVMLFYEGGSLGSLSPGCLESDLELRRQEIWDRGIPEIVEYDMLSPDDFSWGEAVGCGGKIKVVLEPVSGRLRRIFTEIYGRMASGESLILEREAAGKEYIYTLKIWQGDELPQRRVGAGDSKRETDGPAGSAVLSSAAPLTPFSTSFEPKPRLIIFGAGYDSRPIAEIAAKSGFRIAVADWRESTLQHDFPVAERVVCPPAEVVSLLGIDRKDYVLICSHQFQRDRQFLERVIQAAPHYIGIIGSRARIGLLLEGLEPPAALHAPVGLSIGAEGPEEIAVSIVAELIQIRRAGSHKLLKGVESVESGRYLSGGRAEQTYGNLKGVAEAVSGGQPRERRAQ